MNTMYNKIVILDAGHGKETPGKRSPDGTILEWEWTRKMQRFLIDIFISKNIPVYVINHSESDTPLGKRVKLANECCGQIGPQNCLLISLHLDAFTSFYNNASGFKTYVARRASKTSRKVAAKIWNYAIEDMREYLKGNRYIPECKYLEKDFYILKHTHCPAVLVEPLFMTNYRDIQILLNEDLFSKMCITISKAIEDWFFDKY